MLWLSGRYNAEVYAIDTTDGHLLARIPVGKGPHGLCVYPQPGRYSLGHTGVLSKVPPSLEVSSTISAARFVEENTMSDQTRDQEEQRESSTELSRRDFVAMSIAAGIVAATGSAAAADMPVTETDVDIKTSDGVCDAAFIHPATGAYPGVIIWADAFGAAPHHARHGEAPRRRRL